MTDVAELIAEIKPWHRKRMFAMEQRKRSDLALGSYLRSGLGWSLAIPKKERDAINRQALKMIEVGEKHIKNVGVAETKRESEPTIPSEIQEFADIILASIRNRLPWDEIEKRATKNMEILAIQLPVYEWSENIRGFGPVGLATVVAEAGRDLAEFRSPAALWARMGIGMKPDAKGAFIRQGGLPKSAEKKLWIAHGYSRARRSRMWNVGRALVLSNGDGPYRAIYLERKVYERARAEAAGLKVAPAGSVPAKRAAEYMTLGHIDKRARRYMEKCLIKDLWVTWRQMARAKVELEPIRAAPSPAATRLEVTI
jgi:hypothetical protein